jgi:hypothetical protein
MHFARGGLLVFVHVVLLHASKLFLIHIYSILQTIRATGHHQPNQHSYNHSRSAMTGKKQLAGVQLSPSLYYAILS